MKILSLIIGLILLLSLNQANAVASTKSKTETTTTISYEMKKPPGMVFWCPDDGTGCQVTITRKSMMTTGDITTNSNGYLYTTQLTNLVEVTIDGQTYTSTNQSHTFSGGDYCQILECDSYPFLENVSVSLNGVSTDQFGVYFVLIPFPN